MTWVGHKAIHCLLHSTESDQPTLQYFNRHVRSLIADRWEEVGVQLLSEEHQKKINIIKANHHGDVERCCSALFNIWIEQQSDDATWRALIKAVRNAQLTNEANQIEKMLMTSSGSMTLYVTGPAKTGYICTNYMCLENGTFLGHCS